MDNFIRENVSVFMLDISRLQESSRNTFPSGSKSKEATRKVPHPKAVHSTRSPSAIVSNRHCSVGLEQPEVQEMSLSSSKPRPDESCLEQKQTLGEMTSSVQETVSIDLSSFLQQSMAATLQEQEHLCASARATETDNASTFGELSKLQSELMETERVRGTNVTMAKKIEERLRSLGEEVLKKRNKASNLLAGMRYNSESKINEMISKLRGQMLIRQLSDSDQRKYRHEIETLKNSKVQLREFTKAKDAADKMRSEQDDLRKRRDSFYCLSRELKEKETKAKDRMAELKRDLECAREKKCEVSAQKDTINIVSRYTYDFRRQWYTFIRKRQATYQEERRRLREEALEKAKIRRILDLIHLQANVSGGASYCVGVEGESPSSSTTNLDAPEVSAAGGVITTRDNAIDQKPRELVFVRKKDTEEEVLVPAKLTVSTLQREIDSRQEYIPDVIQESPLNPAQGIKLGTNVIWKCEHSSCKTDAEQKEEGRKHPPEGQRMPLEYLGCCTPEEVVKTSYAAHNEDDKKQAPDKAKVKVIRLHVPEARPILFLLLQTLDTSKYALVPCKLDTITTGSSLCTMHLVSGLCLAYYLSSHPGPRPWSRG